MIRIRSRKGVLLHLVRVLLFLPLPGAGIPLMLHAQGDGDTTRRVDTLPPLPRDGGLVVDSTLTDSALARSALPDTVRRTTSRLPRETGAPLGAVGSTRGDPGILVTGKRDLVWRRYFTLFEALRRDMPAYPMSQGGVGLVQAYSYAGADPSSISTLYNGRPLHGVGERAYDFENWPTEFAERYELVRGARALLYGSGDALLTLNIVQPRYDVEGSYVRIWYEQGLNNTTSADLTFATNIGSSGNLSLGFRRIPSDGIYIQGNQQVSSWSGRGALTFHPSTGLTVSLTEVFTDATRGLNGGLTASSPDDPLSTALTFVDKTSQERTLRHDLTLAARYYPHRVTEVDSLLQERLVVDTTIRLDGDIYYSYAERDFSGDSTTANVAKQGRTGVRGALRLPLAFAGLLANGVVEIDDVGRFRVEGGGLLELRGGDLITLRGGAKLFIIGDESSVALVGEVAGRVDSITVRGTVRAANPLNPVQVDAPPDTLRYLNNGRTPLLIEGELRWQQNRLAISLGGTFRRVEPIYGAAPYTMLAADVGTTLPLPFNCTLDNHFIVTIAPDGDRRFPFLHGVSDFYTHWTLLSGNLDLRLGTSFEYQTPLEGVEFDNVTGEFYQPIDATRQNTTLFPVWNAYAQARIGNAYLRVEMRNILDNEFYTMYRYPVWGRGIYLGANWALID